MACRLVKAGWQATRWPDANSIAAWKAFGLGRRSSHTHTYVSVVAHSGGAAAEQAADRKLAKYDQLV